MDRARVALRVPFVWRPARRSRPVVQHRRWTVSGRPAAAASRARAASTTIERMPAARWSPTPTAVAPQVAEHRGAISCAGERAVSAPAATDGNRCVPAVRA